MIRITQDPQTQRAIPEICCDVCFGPIHELSTANAVWFNPDLNPGQSDKLWIVHTGKCDNAMQKVHGSKGTFHNLPRLIQLLSETSSSAVPLTNPHSLPGWVSGDSLARSR